MSSIDKYRVDIPELTIRSATIKKVAVSEIEARFFNIRNFDRSITAGQHTELLVNGRLWMSDTDAEIYDHLSLFRMVKPGYTILLHGLGLGMALNGCLINGASKVTVVENNSDVIDLVGGYWRGKWGDDRIEIIEADALTWNPPKGSRWNLIWHDIWPDICTDNLKTMETLHRRFAKRGDWQESWCRHRCKRIARADKRRSRAYL